MTKPSREAAFLESFGANLRRERDRRQLTQEKLAELADLNPRTVQKIEAGKLNIMLATAARIQHALRCPWNRLLS